MAKVLNICYILYWSCFKNCKKKMKEILDFEDDGEMVGLRRNKWARKPLEIVSEEKIDGSARLSWWWIHNCNHHHCHIYIIIVITLLSLSSIFDIPIQNSSKSDTLGLWVSYLIFVTDATDGVRVNFFGRCKFLQI